MERSRCLVIKRSNRTMQIAVLITRSSLTVLVTVVEPEGFPQILAAAAAVAILAVTTQSGVHRAEPLSGLQGASGRVRRRQVHRVERALGQPG